MAVHVTRPTATLRRKKKHSWHRQKRRSAACSLRNSTRKVDRRRPLHLAVRSKRDEAEATPHVWLPRRSGVAQQRRDSLQLACSDKLVYALHTSGSTVVFWRTRRSAAGGKRPPLRARHPLSSCPRVPAAKRGPRPFFAGVATWALVCAFFVLGAVKEPARDGWVAGRGTSRVLGDGVAPRFLWQHVEQDRDEEAADGRQLALDLLQLSALAAAQRSQAALKARQPRGH